MEFQPVIALGGLVVGVMIGLSGMGGGALMTPLLILLGIRPVVAVGTDLMVMTVTKTVGAWQHRRLGNVDYRTVWRLALGSMPGALMGVGILVALRDVAGISIDAFISRMLGGVLVLVGLVLLARYLTFKKHFFFPWATPFLARVCSHRLFLPVMGLLVGLLVGMSSIGSGTLLVAALSLALRRPFAQIIGIDVTHGALLTAAAAAAHLAAGHVDIPLMANVLVGTLPGVVIGSRLSVRVPDRRLGTVVAMVILVLGASLL